MTRTEAIKAYKEARNEADMILVGYMIENPTENLEGMCKDADPENWKALASRVRRKLEKARSEGETSRTSAPKPNQKASIRSAKAAIRQHPELAAGLVEDPDVNLAISKARQTADTEARATGELKDPERRTAREHSELQDAIYEMVRFRNWMFKTTEQAQSWDWTDEKQEGWIDAIEGIRGSLDLAETAPDFDTQLEELTR